MNKIIYTLCLTLIFSGCSKPEEDLSEKPVETVYGASLEWDGSLYDFQETDLGDNKLRTIVLKNLGDGQSKPIKLDWADKTQTSWKIVPGEDECTNKILNPGEVCLVKVMFSPVNIKNESNAIVASDGVEDSAMAVSGSGVASQEINSEEILELDKSLILFQETAIGSFEEKVFSVRNAGKDVVAGISAAIVSQNFSITESTCKGGTLRQNQSCLVKVSFAPTSVGEHMGEVIISGATTSKNLILKGSARVSDSVLSVNPNKYDLRVKRGEPSEKVFSVTNTGSGPTNDISISFTNGMNFQVLENTCVKALGANQSCSFKVKDLALWNSFSDKMVITGGATQIVVPIEVSPRNSGDIVGSSPMAMDYSYTIEEETTLFDALRASDVVGSVLTYEVVSGPSKGSVSLDGSAFTYIPGENKIGEDFFTFKVANSLGLESAVRKISITITNKEDTPEVQSYVLDVNENESTSFNLNETYVYDPEGGYLFISRVAQPSNGTISLNSNNTLTYTPDQDFEGMDSFVYYVANGVGETQGTLNINVLRVNEIPLAENITEELDEDTSAAIVLIGQDQKDGDTLSYVVVSQPTHGTLTGSGQNLTYTPNLNYNGVDFFTYKVNDGQADSEIATVSLTINPVNDLPVASDLLVSVPEDSSAAVSLSGVDVEGDFLSYEILSNPENGVLSGSVPNLIYIPNTNYTGLDSMTYRVSDGQGNSNTATVSITVIPVNDNPIADNKSVSTDEDTAVAITLSGSDIDGDLLTYSIVSTPAHGALSGAAPNLVYTPSLNYNGLDSFTYRVNDGQGNSNLATVLITVVPVNDAPELLDRTISVEEDTPKSFTLTSTDVETDVVSWEIVSNTSNGTIVSSGLGQYVYTPNLNYNGQDTFQVKVNDGQVDSRVATITLDVGSENDLPLMSDQTLTTLEDTALVVDVSGTDVDGDTLTYSVVVSPSNGTISGTLPNITYTPNLNYNGVDSFQVKANDGSGDSNVASISITVSPVNDAPVAVAETITIEEDIATAIELIGTDVDGDALTYTVVSNPVNGLLTGTVPNLTYTPNANYNGSDSFSFKVNDGQLDSEVATVDIIVNPVNDLPVVEDASFVVAEDSSVDTFLIATDFDLGTILGYTITAPPSHGTLSGTLPNVVYTPNPNYNGPDSFTYRANDEVGLSDPGVYTISVTPVNDKPQADDKTITTQEEVPVAVVLSGSDIDGDSLSYIIETPPMNGTLSGMAPNLIYTPNSDYNGADSFAYRVNDGQEVSDVATVAITVSPVNDAPEADSQNINLDEDTSQAITATGSDSDGDSISYILVAGPSNGTLTGTLPNVVYTPSANFNGNDSFSFQVNDGTINSNIAVVAITVNPINDQPVAIDKSITTNEDQQQSVLLTGSDIDGDVLTYEVVSSPANGTLSGTVPNLTYTPDAEYNGSDSFTYKVNDGQVDSEVATVLITVDSENDLPTVSDVVIAVVEDEAKSLNTEMSGLSQDMDGDTLTWVLVSGPSNGSISGTLPNAVYTPNLNYNGPDSFTYKVNDGTADSEISTASIQVSPVNDMPTWVSNNNISLTILKDTEVETPVSATDADGDSVSYAITSCQNGTCTLNSGVFTFTPDLGYHGNTSAVITCSDGTESCSPNTTVSIEVQRGNVAPTVQDISHIYLTKSSSETIELVGADEDGDTLTAEIVVSPTLGSVSINGSDLEYSISPGSWTTCASEDGECSFTGTKLVRYGADGMFAYREASNSIYCSNEVFSDPIVGTTKSCSYINAQDTLTYRVSDGQAYSNIGTITIKLKEWFDKSWSNRKKLLMPENGVSSSLTDAPILVKLSPSKIDYTKFKSDGSDLRFFGSGGDVLDHEVESWDSSGESVVWVKTSFSSSEQDSKYIWMYYGNPDAVDGQNKTGVWSNGFAAVWHLAETSGQILDSTGNQNHGVESGADGTVITDRAVAGKMGNGFLNTNSKSCFSVPNNESQEISGKITMEAWAKSTDSNQNSVIIQKDIYSSSNWYWAYSLGNDDNHITEVITDNSLNSTYYKTPENYYQNNNWTYIAASYNDVNNRTISYDNGEVNVSNTSASRNMYSGNNWRTLNIVGDCNSEGFKGHLDEIRISNVERNSAWIALQYLSMSDNLIIFWAEESITETLISFHSFDKSNRDSVFGWTEVAQNSNDVRIEDSQMRLFGSDGNKVPLAQMVLNGFSSGIVKVSFDVYVRNFGGEGTYELIMQTGQESLTSGDLYDDGIISNTKWSSSNFGMNTNQGFGYLDGNQTNQLFVSNGDQRRVEITIDMDNKTHSLATSTGHGSGDLNFQDGTVSEFDMIRFFVNELNGNNVDVYFDNVQAVRPL